jgi:hypothetical protein
VKHIALIISILAVSATAFAQTYSNANLNGSYSLQFANPSADSWSKTVSCPTNSSITATGGGSMTITSGVYGVITVDGSGNVASFSVTEFGNINQTASNNTVKITFNSSCQASINNGEIVYKAPTVLTGTGTYSVQSNGTGTMNLTPTTGQPGSFVFQLAGTASTGLSSTALLSSAIVNGKNIGTGIAVHQ